MSIRTTHADLSATPAGGGGDSDSEGGGSGGGGDEISAGSEMVHARAAGVATVRQLAMLASRVVDDRAARGCWGSGFHCHHGG